MYAFIVCVYGDVVISVDTFMIIRVFNIQIYIYIYIYIFMLILKMFNSIYLLI